MLFFSVLQTQYDISFAILRKKKKHKNNYKLMSGSTLNLKQNGVYL